MNERWNHYLTFAEWCKENNRSDYLEAWDDELNDCSPDDIQCGTHKDIYLKCPRGIHESRRIPCERLTRLRKCYCNKCNSFGQFIIDRDGEDKLKQIWGEKNDCFPFDMSYSSTKMVWLKCLKNSMHGEYQITCNAYTSNKSLVTGCPKCHVCGANGEAAECDSLAVRVPQFKEYWSDKNTADPYKITKFSNKKMWWKCAAGKHDDFQRCVAESVRYDFRCPTCSVMAKTSMLQNKVSDYIESLGYTLLHEYECNILPERKWVPNNRFLPCDNEVVELRLIIEVNGRQHYTKKSWHDLQGKRAGTSGEYEFKMQKKRDMFKKWYVLTHGYDYLEIPYTAEKDDYYMELIDEKINYITAKESVTTTA